MIRRKEEREIVKLEQPFGGKGYFYRQDLLNCPDELYGKGRVYSHMTLPPGSQAGYHEHHGDAEVYYILKGRGQINDNGVIEDIKEGDVAVTFEGEGHSIYNNSDEDLEFIALIYYK